MAPMTRTEAIQKCSDLLNILENFAEIDAEFVEENALVVRHPVRGGGGVIIDLLDESVLFISSWLTQTECIESFREGNRTSEILFYQPRRNRGAK